MKVVAPPLFDIDIWRAAREAGLDCQVIKTPERGCFELRVLYGTAKGGVKSYGPDKELSEIMKRECISGLTEVNPEWSELNMKPMNLKPRDLGHSEGPHTVIEVCLANRKDDQRLERNHARLVRAFVHGIAHVVLLRGRLPG